MGSGEKPKKKKDNKEKINNNDQFDLISTWRITTQKKANI